MIFGIGTDILLVSRMRVLENYEKDPFFTAVFTDKEMNEAASRDDKAIYLAGRFAAKEAIYKCLNLSCDVRFNEIEVYTDSNGAPKARLYGALLEYANANQISHIHISISHETEYAVAYAIATLGEQK